MCMVNWESTMQWSKQNKSIRPTHFKFNSKPFDPGNLRKRPSILAARLNLKYIALLQTQHTYLEQQRFDGNRYLQQFLMFFLLQTRPELPAHWDQEKVTTWPNLMVLNKDEMELWHWYLCYVLDKNLKTQRRKHSLHFLLIGCIHASLAAIP